ncbi:MAG: hypothetical protein JRG80_03795 [Deltaproteobacteria bacterium]|nr:hypothetical protein [Deltaproteobacteria bacterium]
MVGLEQLYDHTADVLLYIPEQKGEFEIDIGVDQENPRSTVAKAYSVLVVDFYSEIKKKFEPRSN